MNFKYRKAVRKIAKLQFQSIDGKVVKEVDLQLSDNDKLIVQFPSDKEYPIEFTTKVMTGLKHVLESDKQDIIGIPNGFTFKILHKQ